MRPASDYVWRVGDVRVTKIAELEIPVPLDRLLSGAGRDAAGRHDWLRPHFADERGRGLLSVHGLLVETPAARVLVDTGIGDRRAGTPVPPFESRFGEALARAGCAAGDVDVVVCTHLHFDHTGGNTRRAGAGWEVAFPRARYLVARREWEFWSGGARGDVNLEDTVRPVLAAGRLDLVAPDHRVCGEVRLLPTPGHTPGHVSVAIASRGERAFVTGDLVHHPLQFAEPHIGSPADADARAAAATRRAFCAERARDGALVIGTHFAGPAAGRIVPDGQAYRFLPVPGPAGISP